MQVGPGRSAARTLGARTFGVVAPTFVARACFVVATTCFVMAALAGTAFAGEPTLERPLTLGARTLEAGETLTGEVTYRNRTGRALSIQVITIAVRAPGGTNSGGPFYDLQPSAGPLVLAPDESITVSGSQTIPSGAPLGTWRAYVTYEDSDGSWHDGNEVRFGVDAATPGLPAPVRVTPASAAPASETPVSETPTSSTPVSAAPSSETPSSPGVLDWLAASFHKLVADVESLMSSKSPSTDRASSGASAGPSAPMAASVGGYTVSGNQILDANGQPHPFHGVARPSLEWSPTGENLSPDDYARMASWGANVVRIPLDQDFWLAGAARSDPDYPARIDQQIAWAHAAGLDVILDLHWSDLGNLNAETPGQQPMADQNSLEFWREVAARYKNDPRVLFELYNEPHDISWNTWLNGGPASSAAGEFQAVGMQQLTDAVRGTGAKNVVLVGGVDWAYDLSGVPSHRVQGSNIAYVTHTYEGGEHAPSEWDSHFGFLTRTDPVIATEFGSYDGRGDYDAQFIDYAKSKGISWTAWAWYPGGDKFPALVTDWSGTPTASGQVVRSALASFSSSPTSPRIGIVGALGDGRGR